MGWLAFAVLAVLGAVAIAAVHDRAQKVEAQARELRQELAELARVTLYLTDWLDPDAPGSRVVADEVHRWRGSRTAGTSTSHRAPRSSGARAG